MISRHEIESIRRGRKKLKLTIIFSAVFLAVLTAIIVFSVIIGGIEPQKTSAEPPEVLPGEGIYYGNVVAFPAVDAESIFRVSVNNGIKKDGEYVLNDREFTFVKDELAGGDFLFSYMEDGEVKIFYPSICNATGISYSDLYAIESEDGYNAITRINYLLNGINAVYFDERIPLSSDAAEREAQLQSFGLVEGSQTVVVFDYTDKATATVGSHKLIIGSPTVTGGGYYFTVDGRDYVYSSSSPYIKYAMLGFYSFVSSTLVSEGLEGDSTYEPIITSNFTHWKNTIHRISADPMAQVPTVKAGSTVILEAATLNPITPNDYLSNPSVYNENTNGYEDIIFDDIEVELYTATDDGKIKKALVGKKLGKLYDHTDAGASVDSALVYTLPVSFSTAHEIDFSDIESSTFSYRIVEIEAIVTGSEDITVAGSEVKATDTVRVAYYYTKDGKEILPILTHAVLDLSSPALPADARDALVGAGVGKLSSPVEFSVVYTSDNAIKTPYKTVVTEIVSITDDKGSPMSTVTEKTGAVIYRYALFIDGKISGSEYLTQTKFSSLSDEDGLRVKKLFMGQSVKDGLSITLEQGHVYNEAFRSFLTYVISDVKYFITQEEIVSFSYLNYSERDPFYGESIYKNNTDGYTLYGLDNGRCDHVLGIFGGLGDNSTKSIGFKGEELVSVGITPEKLEKYGCYAHKIRFDLPRGVVVINSADTEKPADYEAAEILSFTLYISDVKEDGTRIVASTLYNIIAKTSESLDFLDMSFSEFWARDNIFMVNVNNIYEIKLDLMMDDIVGSYQLNVTHTTGYITADSIIVGSPPPSYRDVFDAIKVNVIPSGECTPNKVTEAVDASDKYYISLDDLYEMTVKDENKHNAYLPDTLGTTYFKEFILAIFNVDRAGGVSENTAQEVLKSGKKLMKFSVKIDTDGDGNVANEDYYTYEFYHFGDENKIMVRLYRSDAEGNIIGGEVASDCYITRLGFKRIVASFLSLMNGEEFGVGEQYPEFG